MFLMLEPFENIPFWLKEPSPNNKPYRMFSKQFVNVLCCLGNVIQTSRGSYDGYIVENFEVPQQMLGEQSATGVKTHKWK